MATGECTVCAHPEVVAIDAAIRGRTSLRQVATTYSIGRTAVTNHARHVYDRRPPPAPRPMKPTENSSSEAMPIATDLRPIVTADDVIADMQRLRVEAFDLFASAKARSDWKSAERVFGQLVAMVDRFGEMHRVLGPKGAVNVNIDARSVRIATFLDALPIETLRRIKAGEIELEALLPGTEVA